MNHEAREEFLLHRFHRLVNKYDAIRARGLQADESLTLLPGELHALATITATPGHTVTELGKAMGITKSAASQFVMRLAAKGMVVKRKLPDNAKSICIAPSEAGLAAAVRFRAGWDETFAPVQAYYESLDTKTCSSLLQLFSLMEQAMDGFLATESPDPGLGYVR
jgi:DNA-binding MarR family transcriptional regulator